MAAAGLAEGWIRFSRCACGVTAPRLTVVHRGVLDSRRRLLQDQTKAYPALTGRLLCEPPPRDTKEIPQERASGLNQRDKATHEFSRKEVHMSPTRKYSLFGGIMPFGAVFSLLKPGLLKRF